MFPYGLLPFRLDLFLLKHRRRSRRRERLPLGKTGFLPPEVKAIDGHGKGNEGADLHQSAAVRPCDQVIRQQRRGVEKKKQAGPGHVVGPQGQGGAGHGQAGEQAVEAIPGEQGAARVQTQ